VLSLETTHTYIQSQLASQHHFLVSTHRYAICTPSRATMMSCCCQFCFGLPRIDKLYQVAHQCLIAVVLWRGLHQVPQCGFILVRNLVPPLFPPRCGFICISMNGFGAQPSSCQVVATAITNSRIHSHHHWLIIHQMQSSHDEEDDRPERNADGEPRASGGCGWHNDNHWLCDCCCCCRLERQVVNNNVRNNNRRKHGLQLCMCWVCYVVREQ